MTEPDYDYLIVGAGIVGCAVARELCLRSGVTVGIMEKEADPVAESSSGNTGHIGTWSRSQWSHSCRGPIDVCVCADRG